MTFSFSAKAMQRRAASLLAERGIAATEGMLADGSPTLLLGPGTAGSNSAFVKIAPIVTGRVDVLGLTQPRSGPHTIDVVLEADESTWAFRLPVMGVLLALGAELRLYQSASGNTVGAEDIIVGNLQATFAPAGGVNVQA